MADLTSNYPVPSFLAKRGIVQIGDNVSPGQSVVAPAGIFFTLFRDEILASCVKEQPGRGKAEERGLGIEPLSGA